MGKICFLSLFLVPLLASASYSDFSDDEDPDRETHWLNLAVRQKNLQLQLAIDEQTVDVLYAEKAALGERPESETLFQNVQEFLWQPSRSVLDAQERWTISQKKLDGKIIHLQGGEGYGTGWGYGTIPRAKRELQRLEELKAAKMRDSYNKRRRIEEDTLLPGGAAAGSGQEQDWPKFLVRARAEFLERHFLQEAEARPPLQDAFPLLHSFLKSWKGRATSSKLETSRPPVWCVKAPAVVRKDFFRGDDRYVLSWHCSLAIHASPSPYRLFDLSSAAGAESELVEFLRERANKKTVHEDIDTRQLAALAQPAVFEFGIRVTVEEEHCQTSLRQLLPELRALRGKGVRDVLLDLTRLDTFATDPQDHPVSPGQYVLYALQEHHVELEEDFLPPSTTHIKDEEDHLDAADNDAEQFFDVEFPNVGVAKILRGGGGIFLFTPTLSSPPPSMGGEPPHMFASLMPGRAARL